MLGESGEAGLRGLVFRAAGSIRSASMGERYVLDRWVCWWSDLDESKRSIARSKGKGAPWAHVPIHDCRTLAADLLVAPSEVARTQGQAEHASIPGIRSTEWTLDEIAGMVAPVQQVPLSPSGQAMHRAAVAAHQDLARRRAAAADKAERDRVAMVKRDEYLEWLAREDPAGYARHLRQAEMEMTNQINRAAR